MPPVCVPRPTNLRARCCCVVTRRRSLPPLMVAQPVLASELLFFVLVLLVLPDDSSGLDRAGKASATSPGMLINYLVLIATPRRASVHGIETQGIAISPSLSGSPTSPPSWCELVVEQVEPSSIVERGSPIPSRFDPQQYEWGAIKGGYIVAARARLSAYAECISRDLIAHTICKHTTFAGLDSRYLRSDNMH